MAKYLIILFSFSYAVVTVGPGGGYDFTTIQAAIDYVTANPSDIEIEVYPGTYEENLLIEANMIIRSVGDADNTTIDGSRSSESTIVIRPQSGSLDKPIVEIDGFGIQNGKGTDVENKTITFEDGTHPVEKVGGGLFVFVNSPKVNTCKFLNNGIESTTKGGAIFSASDSDDIGILIRDDYEVHPGLEPATGTLDFSNNTFLGNDADYGHSVYIFGDDYELTDLSEGYFDIYDCESQEAPPYWVNSLETELDASNGDGNLCLNPNQTDYYVSVDGNDNFDGTEEFPFLTINKALSVINPDEFSPVTIHLLEGTFAPYTTGEIFPVIMISNVNLTGQSEDVTILDAKQTGRVITLEGCQNNIISNLTITNGLADGATSIERYGGGVFIINSAVNINFVNISYNNAGSFGGGIYVDHSDCDFSNINLLNNNSSTRGGGIYSRFDSNISIENAIIDGNKTYVSGGGIYLLQSVLLLSNSIISENEVTRVGEYNSNGGGIYAFESQTVIDNVIFNANKSGWFAGGLRVHGDPNDYFNDSTILSNVIFYNNEAEGGAGGMYVYLTDPILTNVVFYDNVTGEQGQGSDLRLWISSPIITNSIFWGNSQESIYIYNPNSGYFPTITYSDIQGGWAGYGNIDLDPLFTDPENGDYTLQSGSPCIDAGTADIDGDGYDDIADYFGDAPDMGAFEFEGSSLSGDLNGDGLLNVLDVVVLVNIVLGYGEIIDAGDMNGDGILNVLDVVALVSIILEG